MAISRMQEPRQLYGLGSLVRKITRPIKKAAKVVKKVAKSDIGKLALLYAAGAGLGGSTALGGTGGSFFSRLANPSNLLNLKNVFGSKALNLPGISGVGGEGIGRFFNPFNKANPLFFKGGDFSATRAGITASVVGAALPFLAPDLLAPKFEDVEEEDIDITQTPESIALLNQRARDFYNYGDPDLMFMPRKEYVMRNFYAAEGGSVPESKVKGYDTPAGFNKFDYPTGGVEVRTPKKEGGKLTQYDRSKAGALTRPKFDEGGISLDEQQMEIIKGGGPKIVGLLAEADELMGTEGDRLEMALKMLLRDNKDNELLKYALDTAEERGKTKLGVLMDLIRSQRIQDIMAFDKGKKSVVDDISVKDLARKEGSMKDGGLMDLGGLEMDFRAKGGFVPIGSKEKADDVPARLSKNEFVMTADAVRGAGNGSIERGAQKMYNTMKQLESRVV